MTDHIEVLRLHEKELRAGLNGLHPLQAAAQLRVAEAISALAAQGGGYWTHHHDFYRACEIARNVSDDAGDRAYWQHQMNVLDRIEAASPPVPVERGEECKTCNGVGLAHREEYNRLPWMTDGQWRCACLLADVVGGFHHVLGTFKPCGKGVKITHPAHRFSTFDSAWLTTLVLLAHDRAVRVEIAGGVAHRVTLMLHPRTHVASDGFARHPSIGEAVSTHRKYWPQEEPIQ